MRAQVTEEITIAQAKQALRESTVLYFSKDGAGNYRMDRRRARPLCLMGPAGIGKTEIVRQVAEEQGLAFLSYSVTHHTRQSAIGLPSLVERTVDGKTVTVTEYTLSEIIAEIYRVMEESGKREGILFLDEFNCASETLRPAMLQLLQNKTFGTHAIPEGWMLVLAGNPGEYNASAQAMDAVTADRMRLLWLKPDYAAWREYMCRHGVHPIVLSYLEDHKRQFYVFEKGADGTGLVTARGWEDLSVMLRMMEQHGFAVDLAFVAQFLQSAQVAREFFTYYRQYDQIIADGLPDAILNGNGEEALGKLAKMNFTEKWALISILLLRLEECCRNEEDAVGAERKMDAAIRFCRAHFAGQPQLEFLVSGITGSDPCAFFLARHGCKAYREAVQELYLESGSPSAKAIKQLLQAG